MSSKTGPSRAGKSGLSRISDMAKILKMDAGIIRYAAKLAGIEIVRADNGINKAVRVEDRERLKVICIKFKEQMATIENMSRKMRSGEDTSLKDKDGKAILVHSHVADAKGDIYLVNAFLQAVPIGDGVAVQLADLLRTGEVRVLTAQEVLEMQASKPAPAAAARSRRRKKEQLPPAASASAESQPSGDADPGVLAEISMVISTIPDKMLADELRRRGYVFSAARLVIDKV